MLYVFLDESGNFDFSQSGSRYFILSALSVTRPFPYLQQLLDLKHDLWTQGSDLEYFHATEDKQAVRNQVFQILATHASFLRLDSVIIEKRKTHPTLQKDHARFYRKMFEILMHYVLQGRRNQYNRIVIVTDSIPVKKKKKYIEKEIKRNIAGWARQHGNSYSILHCSSKSELSLQAVDYMVWAINRKWSQSDLRSYNLISASIKSEFDVFRKGTTYFY